MADQIPSAVVDLLKEAGLNARDACWQLPQNNKVWIVKHKALEKIAAIKDIRYTDCKVELADAANQMFAVSVVGHLGDRSEWSIGEASSANTRQSYPFAMAEKRAKDRVILKLIGLHADVYSEEEADEFKDAAPAEGDDLVAYNAVVREEWASISRIKVGIRKEDWFMAAESWAELSDEVREILDRAPTKGGVFTTEERKHFRPDGEIARCIANDKKRNVA